MTAARKPSMSGYPNPAVRVAPQAVSALALTGKRWLVVGGTDGLGRALARAAAARGASVTVVGRTFRDEGVTGIAFVRGDLSSMKEARRLGETLPVDGVEVVVLTTGIITAPTRQVTAEGLELDLAISALSRAALLETLLPRLRAASAGRPRVFVMGFPGAGNLGEVDDLNAEGKYDQMAQHMNTVAVNEAMVLSLAKRYPELGVYGLNPGLIKTNIRANMLGEGSLKHRVVEFFIGLFTASPDSYAARMLPVLAAPELERHTGVHFGGKGNPSLSSDGMDDARVTALDAASRALLARALA
jgi:NAD(P)-dependent dehydrogenase (short-subunit alcohol dehydrogenase family)